ncbi:uncharacterized protein LOC128721132 [Anopheles nili]|uniref:uncharacterized protein LOC128721132 n=1 Tax=Anopheles nili TaxID=185578 RepID=UPI00237A8B6C|nr:uncharacterized protein LOC128721132 [Anopheles nili]
MDTSINKTDNNDNILTQNYLQELLNKAHELKASIAEKENQKLSASNDLNALSCKLYSAIENEYKLKKNRIVPQQQNTIPSQDNFSKPKKKFYEQFSNLQRILGISISCSPEKKIFEIMFNDIHRTKVYFAYTDKGITLERMHPYRENIETIQSILRETGDLIGFLSVLNKKLANA